MDKGNLLDEIADTEICENTSQMLHEQLLPNNTDEITLPGQVLKPVSTMTVRCETIRKVTTSDGSPVPELSESPFQIDIAMWVPCMYGGEIMLSLFMSAFLLWSMNSNLKIIGSSHDGTCEKEVGFATYLVASISLVKAILAISVASRLVHRAMTEGRGFQTNRVVLRRQVYLCRTVTSKTMFTMLFICDLMTFATFFICMPIRPIAMEWCQGFY